MAAPVFNLEELKGLIEWEAVERFEEGFDVNVDGFRRRLVDARSREQLLKLYDELQRAEPRKGYPYREPTDWREILSERPASPPRFSVELDGRELYDRALGAWLGRCAGCMLGKPVEGWSRERIERALRRADEYPLRKPYFPLAAFLDLGEEQLRWIKPLTREHIGRAERDDDLDYTVLNLLVYERRGPRFTTNDVAEAWLSLLPYHLTYTAERAAYRNLVLGLRPPETATYLNPFREWIGAQIRADLWGYVSPGDPGRAAELAYRDARLSHVKNGVYGEMMVAAMLSLSYVIDSPREIVREALKVIPERSRLAEAVRYVLNLHSKGVEWEEAIGEVLSRYGRYHPVHTINNAAVVVAALLWGEGDFARTVIYAVTAGLDTDCNGATAGSIVGLMQGASRLPREWIDPLRGKLATALSGYGELSIEELAERTAKCAIAHLER
ncbi:MAG: ADP-ribosylglycohydrolase family protein [Thermofilaceae archaeon]